TTCHPIEWSGVSPRIESLWSTKILFSFDTPPFPGCFLVAIGMSDLGHIDTVFWTVGRGGRQTSSTTGGDRSELQDFNQLVIREFRANQGRVSGQLANRPVLLLTIQMPIFVEYQHKTSRQLPVLMLTRFD